MPMQGKISAKALVQENSTEAWEATTTTQVQALTTPNLGQPLLLTQ